MTGERDEVAAVGIGLLLLLLLFAGRVVAAVAAVATIAAVTNEIFRWP